MAYVVFVVRKADTAAAEQAVSVNVIFFPWRLPMLHLFDFTLAVLCGLAGVFFMGAYASTGAPIAALFSLVLCLSALFSARLFAGRH